MFLVLIRLLFVVVVTVWVMIARRVLSVRFGLLSPRSLVEMKHWETHPEYIDGCFGCKLTTIKADATPFSMERAESGPTSGMTDREYVRNMYADRRAAGLEDPVPANKKAAALAPGKGVFRKATGV